MQVDTLSRPAPFQSAAYPKLAAEASCRLSYNLLPLK